MSKRGQPRGFYLLFLIEMWERFGFYTVQTILVLYMTKALHLTDDASYLLYGTYSAMLWLTPVIGGYLADRFLGFRKAIVLGGVLFIFGYLLTAIPNDKFFFLGLSLQIVANGFFKPNVSTILGDLYGPTDARREGGFTLYYMGINLGALVPPVITGAIVASYGWHMGFLLAAIGMVISMTTYWFGKGQIAEYGLVPSGSPLKKEGRSKWTFHAILWIGIIISVFIFFIFFRIPKETDLILGIASLFVFCLVVYYMLKEKKRERNKMLACLILIIISIGFWALYNQTFTSLMLYADRNMDKHFLGFTIDTEFTQFFNPFFIIVFSPLLSKLWSFLDSKSKNPSIPAKFAIGILLMSFGFLFIGFGSKYFGHQGDASPWWLTGSYLIQTLGELMLSPIGLSMITVLSPKHLMGLMMGVWFLTSAAASAIGGGLATIADVPKNLTPAASIQVYAQAFFIYGALALALAILAFCLIPFLKRLIHGPAEMTTVKK